MENVNWFSMVCATLLPIVLGYLVYRRSISTWIKSAGREGIGSVLILVISTLGSIVLSFFLAWFMLDFTNGGIHQEAEFDTFGHGAWHGVFMAVVVITPVIVINGLFRQTTWKAVLINVLFWLVTLALMGGILDVMNHWRNIPMPEGLG